MIANAHVAQVSLPSDTEVKVTRRFNAPRTLVYRAHAEPALIRRWMLGPPGWTMPVCEMDLRVGGAYCWRWRSDDGGQEFGFYGVFTEVIAPERIAHTQQYDPGSVGADMAPEALVTLDLTEKGGVTTLTVLIDFKTKENRDAAVSTGMTDGMEMGYKRLDAIFAELA